MLSKRLRRPTLTLVLVLLVAGTLIVVQWASPTPETSDGRPATDDVEAGRSLAERACDRYTQVVELVRANSSAEVVFSRMDDAERLAVRAAAHDPVWVPLASGLQAVRFGLANDDGTATELGVDIIREQCPRTSPHRAPR